MERIKKIIELGIFFLIQEAWKLVCNLYGLFYNPFLVLRVTRKERDWMQIVLIGIVILSPFLLFSVGLPTWVVGQKILGLNFPRLNRLALMGGGLVVLTEGLVILYLLYWAWKVIKKNHMNSFSLK